MTPLSLGQFHLNIPITPLFVFALLGLVLLAWLIFTLVVRYHWKSYGAKKIEVFTMNFFYLAGSAIFIGTLFIAAILYLGSGTNTP